MTFWTMLCPRSWELHLYFSMCLILLPGSIIRSGLHCSLFFTSSSIPTGEVCLCGHINVFLTEAQQQFLIGLSLFLSKRGHKARPWTGFHFTVQKRPMPASGGAFLAKRPHLESGTETNPGGKKCAGSGVSASSADARKMGAGTPNVSQTMASSSSSSLGFKVGMLSHFWDQWRSITSNRFVLNMA